MISRRKAIVVAVTALIGAATPAWAQKKNSTLVGQFDTDHDGTVDLAEAKKAGSDTFDKLDTNKTGMLDLKQLHGRLTRKQFAAADADKNGTLSKDEYLAVVEQRFDAADAKHDGKLVNWEFHTPAGRALTRLLR
jgi:hypothetical protein